jgi:zinc protease
MPVAGGRRLPLLAGLTLLAAGVVATAGCARPPAPAAGGGAAAALPAPIREVLPNGLRLIVQEHRAAEIVAVHLWVGVGVRHETPDGLGYSHFMEHMLFKGTDRWGPGHVDRTVEGLGGRSNAVTSFDYTNYYIVVPRDGLELAVRLLQEMAYRSIFDPQEIAREREVIFEEARIEQDNPRTALVRQLYGLVFGDNPYGRPVLGTPATMNAATRERLLAYYRRHYTPENMTLVIVGPVEPRRVRALVGATFGRERPTGYRPAPAPAPPPLTTRISRDVPRPEQQAFLGLGWQAPRADDPEGFALDLVAAILGGGESSRLQAVLRDTERLVSNITMSYSAQMGGGIVSIRCEAEAKDLARVEELILAEIAKIQEQGVTEEERQLALTRFESQHAFDTETAEGLAGAYGLAETTWALEEELRYVERLRGISREQIQAAARRYLSRSVYVRLAFVPRPASN